MKIYTGIDIIEVDRIKNNIHKHGNRFLNRVYTENEIEYCESKNINKYQSYAGKFAAKEAVFKATSKMLNNKFEIEWKDIEILNDKQGRPLVNLNCSNLLEREGFPNIQIDISISHISTTAVANAVVVCL